MAAQKPKILEVYVKQFCYKCVQIIVQSRSGEPLNTRCIPTSHPTWFNLAIGDDHKAQNSASAILSEKVVNFEQHFLVDISLQNENEFLLLETWSIEMSKYDGASTKNPSIYYKNLTQLLKSFTCMSRMTPAYNISRSAARQGYKIGYRIYRSKLDLQNLGSGSVKFQIGSVDTPLATVKLSVYHRSKESLHISTQSFSDRISFSHLPPVVQSSSSAARPCYTLLTSRVRTLSQTSDFESRLTDTPPSVIVYSSSGERRSSPYGYKIEGNQKMKFGDGGSVKFVLGTPPHGGRCSTSPKSCSQKQSENYYNQVGSSPVSTYSREAYGSPTSMGGTDESWVINSTKSQFYYLKDSDCRKKVVRVTSGFNTRPDDPSMTTGGTNKQVVSGAFVGSPAEQAVKILNDGRQDENSCQDWLQRVNIQKKSLHHTDPSSDDRCNEQEIKCSIATTRKQQKRRNVINEPILHKRDLAFANEESPSDKLSFYQSTRDLMNEFCFRESSAGGQENFSQISQELREYNEDAKEFDQFWGRNLRQ